MLPTQSYNRYTLIGAGPRNSQQQDGTVIISDSDPDRFLGAFDTFKKLVPPAPDGGIMLFSALSQAMKYSNGEGNVFIVTGSAPADNYTSIITLEEYWQKRVVINIILRNYGKLPDYYCVPPTCGVSPAQVAQRTGGQVIFAQTSNDLANLFSGLPPYMQYMQLLELRNLVPPVKQQANSFTVYIDSLIDRVVIYAIGNFTGVAAPVAVTDATTPTPVPVPLSTQFGTTLVTNMFTNVYRIDITSAPYTRGAWTFTMTVANDPTAPFALSVHGETPNGYITLRYTQAPWMDVGILQPPSPKSIPPNPPAPIYSIIHSPTDLTCIGATGSPCAKMTMFALDRVTPVGNITGVSVLPRDTTRTLLHDACTSQYVTEPFQCPGQCTTVGSPPVLVCTPFYIFVTGSFNIPINATSPISGTTYQRLVPAVCNDFKCKHGDQQGNGLCQCATPYTGMYCDQLTCLNGGTFVPLPALQCVCPQGYAGQVCETLLP
jgi:hypothetical protein